MKLSDYLTETSTRRVAFARRLGVSPSCITLWCSGQRTPSAAHAALIKRVTRGRVTIDDFIALRSCEPLDWRCRVRAWLVRHSRDMRWLAARLGVSYSTVASALNGSKQFSISMIRRMCAATDSSIGSEAIFDDPHLHVYRRATRKRARARSKNKVRRSHVHAGKDTKL